MTNRRYSEAEIALILQHAGAEQERALDATNTALTGSSGDGLTLAQLQEIGTEVGIAPEFVTRAASAVARGDLVPTQQRTWLGLPVGVSRTIHFGRPVSDEEWDRIVVTLRETFDTRGRLHREGAFRQWTNGNLQALLEPAPNGHRLRLSTRKGDVAPRVWLGASLILGANLVWLLTTLRGGAADAGAAIGPFVMAAAGAATLLSMGLQLPRWAKIRASQMEHIAAVVTEPNRGLPERL